MTTRKTSARPTAARLVFAAALSAVVSGVGGCATPGPLHVYSVATSATEIRDTAVADVTRDIPSFLAPTDQLTGFAYDPFTDHFFLRLAPGNRIRVVDRPARAIKREFTVDALPPTGGGDLAIKPSTGHVYFLTGTARVTELTRLGEFVRSFDLASHAAPPLGIAYDATHDVLQVLWSDRKITTHTFTGETRASTTQLERDAGPSLAFDPEQREFYAQLVPVGTGIGVFDEQGRLVRTLPSPASFVDVGPHSFLRLF